MATITQDQIQPGDTVRIRGDRAWLPVLSVHEQGVEVMDKARHHWIRYGRLTKHKAAA